MKTRAGIAVLVLTLGALALLLVALRPAGGTPPFGFSKPAADHLRLERTFMRQPEAERIRASHHFLTASPHPAGSARNRELAEWLAGELRAAGFDAVEMTSHDVLLPYPVEVSVEIVRPQPFRASLRERGTEEDPDTRIGPDAFLRGFHAYSASGDVTADVLYAGEGHAADYDWLAAHGLDVRGRIVLVRHSSPYGYRGFKVWNAEQRGAAGVLIFSDPATDGSARGSSYPVGPWAPDDAVERGGVAYDFLVAGDPLTPGWASVPGARRLRRDEAPALPKIPSAPLSAVDAAPLLRALGGPRAPDAWQGRLPFPYHVGAGPARVRLRVESADDVRPVWTVTARLTGKRSPDEVVIVGNHRDAWVYGGVDPSSGTAALLELARGIGALVRGGWRPKRSILLASWDAEEFALISSTEWAEQHQEWLRDGAVAYLNVDSAASGPRLSATAVPSLARLVNEVAQAVRDPAARIPLAARARDAGRSDASASGESASGVADTRVGGGSDYTVFLNHLGIPIADIGFRGPFGVYHSLYDTHQWVTRHGDPGFRYHVALVQLWGLMVLRLAEADVLPLDPAATAVFIKEGIDRLTLAQPRAREALLDDARAAVEELTAAAVRFGHARDAALERGDPSALERLSQQVRLFERAFLDVEGLTGRSWYRHLLHAPAFTYQPQVLPEIVAAFESGDDARLARGAERLAAAVRRAAVQIGDDAPSPTGP